jgi:hypothetical protein
MAWLPHGSVVAANKGAEMTKHMMVLLIAAFAGMFQALAEHVTRATMQAVYTREVVQGLGRPRELACQTYPDGTARYCASGRNRALKKALVQASWKAVCHRDPREIFLTVC